MSMSSGNTPEILLVKRKFPNGDFYQGGWLDGLPEGQGTYVWADGSKYEGGWKRGAKDGLGKYTWPSKATYQGEWQDSAMHGIGTYSSPDGTWYKGGWANDAKHGLGKKRFANNDCFEGLWRNGKAHGPGRYVWADKNEYDGEWKGGKMNGQGTFLWNTKERYDGEWADGREHGMGIFTWRDGSSFDGFWAEGRKDGLGVFRPARRGWEDEVAEVGSMAGSDDTGNDGFPNDGEAAAKPAGDHAQEASPEEQAHKGHHRLFLREYKDGRLRRSEALSREEVTKLQAILDHRRHAAGRAGHSALDGSDVKFGETVHKGHGSYDLMLNLQLGIRWSVGKVSQEAVSSNTEASLSDYNVRVKQDFPRGGGAHTPPHPSQDFKWKDYCPAVFAKLRENFGLDAGSYMLSLCGDMALRLMSTPGKSGAMFFISHDDKYLVKTLRQHEMELLLKLLPKYYKHAHMYPHTLLTRFYGLYRIQPRSSKKAARFVVMGNIFNSDLKIHQMYDLKGSTHGRSALANDGKPSSILKDLDVKELFKLEHGWTDRLVKQLEVDCKLMEQLKIMDYSLLMGVHVRNEGNDSTLSAPESASDKDEAQVVAQFEAEISHLGLDPRRANDLIDLVRLQMLGSGRGKSGKGKRNPTDVLAMRPLRSETLRPMAHVEGGTDELGYSLGQTRCELGNGMAATAVPKEGGGTAKDVVLYFGIIDILQEYNLQKRMEHAFKSVQVDSKTISAVDPRAYSKRFQKFMAGVFV